MDPNKKRSVYAGIRVLLLGLWIGVLIGLIVLDMTELAFVWGWGGLIYGLSLTLGR